jgi:hypothetical protein
MAFKALLIFLVIAILMDDSSSIRKTEEEEKEDEEVAKAVNRTLAEEEKKRKEEEDEKKKQLEQEKNRTGTGQEVDSGTGDTAKEKGQNGACPTVNLTCPDRELCRSCPEVKECSPCGQCPEVKLCPIPVDCPEPMECPEQEVCPSIECGPCPPVICKPCSSSNNTLSTQDVGCPENSGQPMSIPVAMAVGAAASVLVMGVATTVGLVIRYVPPTVGGFLFVAVIILVWYLSSQYPETARELGGRAWTALQEATVALGHRIVEAIRHHNEQVGVPVFLVS